MGKLRRDPLDLKALTRLQILKSLKGRCWNCSKHFEKKSIKDVIDQLPLPDRLKLLFII